MLVVPAVLLHNDTMLEIYSDVVADPPEQCILDAVNIAKSKSACAVVGGS